MIKYIRCTAFFVMISIMCLIFSSGCAENGSSQNENIPGSSESDSAGDDNNKDADQGLTADDVDSDSVIKVYIDDESGNVVSTKTNLRYDNEYRILDPVTGDNGNIPLAKQGLDKSERRATEASKYNFDQNPLINRDRQENETAMPSFNIDDTGFVSAGTKLSDLEGKTLTFFTADNYAAWSYRNEKGERINEWQWFEMLKEELGLNIKYTVKQHTESTQAALQAMNAGDECDLLYSNHVVFPSVLCISSSITDKVSINNLGSSPGVCKMTMDICKWANTLRLISPIGCVDVLWYNQTLTQQLGLSDPHTMWENGVWNWDSFRAFLTSAPASNKSGQRLCAFVEWPHNASYIWPSTNGCVYIKIDNQNSVPAILNGWDNPRTLEAWEFITSVHNSVNFGTDGTEAGLEKAHLGLYEGTTLMSATMYTQIYRDTEYSKDIQINWVPYPLSTKNNEDEQCQYYGFGMMLPKKTSNTQNTDIALKFMELWATRFTESIFDNLNIFEYYNFNYKQRKQYFDFVTRNVVFGLAMNDFEGSEIDTQTNFFKAFMGSAEYNVRLEAAKASNLVQTYIEQSLRYGQ